MNFLLRIHAKRLVVLVWACLYAGPIGFAQAVPSRAAHVDLVTVNQHTFRLSISFADKLHTPASMFVTPESTKKTDIPKVVKEGSWSGITNGAGQLLMDRTAGLWMLKDSRGRVVIPAKGSSRTLPLFEISFDYRLKSDQAFRFNGSCS